MLDDLVTPKVTPIKDPASRGGASAKVSRVSYQLLPENVSRSRTPRNEKRIAPTPPHPPHLTHIVRPFIHPSSTAQAKPGGWRRCHRQPTPRGRRAPAPRRHRPQRQSRRRFLQVTRRRDRRERPGRARRSTAAPDARGRVHHQSRRVRREHRARPGARLRRANRALGRRRAGRMGEFLFIFIWALGMTSCFVHRASSSCRP